MNGLKRILQSLTNGWWSHSLKSIIFATTDCKAEMRGTFIATLRRTLTDCSNRGITTQLSEGLLNCQEWIRPPGRSMATSLSAGQWQPAAHWNLLETLWRPTAEISDVQHLHPPHQSMISLPLFGIQSFLWAFFIFTSIKDVKCDLSLSKKPIWRSQWN